MELTHDQAEVLEKLEAFARGEGDSAVAALSGYAGVGKTTVVGQLVAALSGDMTVAVAAPTNKAVTVLRGKVTGGDA
mgnify:FL=1